MSFQWTTPPDVFNDGIDQYVKLTFDTLFQLCVDYAARIQVFMRSNAPWNDSCMPGKEYLRAEAFRDEGGWQVGIRAFYDLDLYRQNCGEPAYDFGFRHETMTFSNAGAISIILPRADGSVASTVLGNLADELWDAVRALYK